MEEVEVFSTLYIYFIYPTLYYSPLIHTLQTFQIFLRNSFYFHFFHQTPKNGLAMRFFVVEVLEITSTLLPPAATKIAVYFQIGDTCGT